MYAVIHTGGKQYRVAKNDVIEVEKLPGEAGETIDFGEVLMLGDGAEATIGAPLVDGALVRATILEQARGPKIIVFKKKRRKNYRRRKGHRQDLTVLRITDIVPAEAKPAKPAKPKPAPAAEAPDKAAKPAKAKPAPAAEAPDKAAKPAKAKPKAAPAAEAPDKAAKPAKAKPAKAAATKTSTKAKKSAKSDPSSKAGGTSAEEKG